MTLRGTLIVGAVVGALAVVVAGCGGPGKGEVVGFIPWQLTAVSDDARTLTLTHEIPHCGTGAGAPVVRARGDVVEITVPEVSDGDGGEMACTAEMRIGSSDVTLARPLGSRTLARPTTRGVRPIVDRLPLRMRPRECVPLLRVPEGAAARDVPWVANRIAACTAPLPASLRQLPIMRRARTSDDALPERLVARAAEHGVILRTAAARRITPDRPLWLVPGPRWTCVGRIVRDEYADLTDCQSTRTVAGRGLFVAATCVKRTPRRIAIAGVVPAGTDRVRLVPRRGAARSVSVGSDGTWSARAPYPLEVAWGQARLAMTYDMRACWA